jgi:molecular chaperone GrpE
VRGYPTHPADGGMEHEREAPAAEAELETELLEQSLGIAELAAERDSYLDQLQRVAAEYANFRRRTENERVQERKNAARELLSQLAPIADDFERALNHVPEEVENGNWVEGVRLIEKKLEAVLERADVRKIDALGQPFDPAVHEAVAQDPDNTQNLVVEVYQNGYTLGNQLLRPVMVRVGNLPSAG